MLRRTSLAKIITTLIFCLISASGFAQPSSASSYILPKYMYSDISEIDVDLLVETNSPNNAQPSQLIEVLKQRGIVSAASPFYYLTDSKGSLIVYVYVFEDNKKLRKRFAEKVAQAKEEGSEVVDVADIGERAYMVESDYSNGYIDFYYGNVEVTITSHSVIDLIDFASVYAQWLQRVYSAVH